MIVDPRALDGRRVLALPLSGDGFVHLGAVEPGSLRFEQADDADVWSFNMMPITRTYATTFTTTKISRKAIELFFNTKLPRASRSIRRRRNKLRRKRINRKRRK